MVKAAYSSGKPAHGVGAGNATMVIDETADIVEAARNTRISMTNDHGSGCSADGNLLVDGSAISQDGGKTFSRPLRVSHAVSPASDPIRVGANDDLQDLAMDAENIHMVWGDARSGFQGTYYGRVAFSAYEFTR